MTYHQGGRPGNGYPVSGFGGHGGQHQLHYYKGSLNVVVRKGMAVFELLASEDERCHWQGGRRGRSECCSRKGYGHIRAA